MAKFLAKPIIGKNGGDEGGEILLEKADTNTSIAGTGVTIDIWQNRLRFFEQGGDARGAYIDITAASNGVGSNLLAGGGGGATTLDGLTDVVITSPEEFQSLVYDGTNWVNKHSSVVSYVRNAETTTLTTGTVVYLFGATGDHATVKRADNDSDATSSKTIGLVGANIAASQNGPVITRGYVDGIDLSTGYASGDVLWLGEDGAFTKTKPSAPEHLVFVGVVVRATNNGIIYVATQNGYELDELHDVSIVDKTSGDFLKYNGTLWVNDPINLGTDTTGDYVASLVAGTGITLSNNSGESATPTVALTNSAVTVNGTSISLGGSGTVTAAAGTLTGTSLNSSVTGSSLTSVGSLTGLIVAGTTTVQQVREKVTDSSISTNVMTCDYSTGSIFYQSTNPSNNFTVNVTNAPTDNGYAITISVFVTQGTTGYIPNALQVAGSSQTIKWAGGTAPTPTSSSGKIDLFTFTLIRRSSAWTVLGSANLNY